MQGAGAGKVCAQKLHLIRQNISALKIDVLSMGRSERNCQELHPCLLWSFPGFVVIAADTGGDNVVPAIWAALTYGAYMIA
jgi:hypothetical protein